MRTRIVVLVLFGLLIPPVKAGADEGLKIIRAITDTVSVYDQQGEFLREISSKELEPLPRKVTAENDGLLEIDLNGKSVWLDELDVRLNREAQSGVKCKELKTQSASVSRSTRGAMGYGGLCE